MAWVQSHQELANHPKTKRFKRALGVSTPQAIGHLHLLWWWALDYAQDGSLKDFTPDDIAEAAEYEGEGERFLDALIVAGFVDADTIAIHDWDDYGNKYLKRREQSRIRQQRFRDEHGQYAARNASPDGDKRTSNALLTRESRSSNTVKGEERRREEHSPLPPTGECDTDSPSGAGVSANGAKPRKPKRAKRESDDPYWTQGEHYERFRAWYSEYPRKVDPQGAMKAWREVLGDDDGDARTMNALWTLSRERWREWRGRAIEHVPYPASWLGKREWEFTREFVEAGR